MANAPERNENGGNGKLHFAETPSEGGRSGYPGQRRKSGRPNKRVNSSMGRSVLRLFVTTNEPWVNVERAFEKSGAPKKLWLRKWLEKITGVGRNTDLDLHDLRFGDDAVGQQRAVEQREALRADRDRRARIERQLSRQPSFQATSSARPGSQVSALHAIGLHGHPVLVDRGQAYVASFSEGPYGGVRSSQRAVDGDGILGSTNGASGQDESLFRTAVIAIPPDPPRQRQTSASESQRTQSDQADAKVQRRASTISKSSVVRCLKSKQRSVCSFVAKRCSISLSSVASRLSLRHGRSLPTALSDYAKHYHRPGQDGAWSRSMSFQDEGSKVFMAYNGTDCEALSAVEMLQRARFDESHDFIVEDQLKRKRDGMSVQQWYRYVIGYDVRGVTALHLAVAYGYRATCGLLIESGASCQAETQQGQTPRTFAKAAQKLAGHQPDLYYRIMTCREWVQRNRVPPVPREKEASEPQVPPRRSETSQTAQLHSHMASSSGQGTSLRRKAINGSRVANDQTLHSFSAEDVSSVNIPKAPFNQDDASSASTTSLADQSADMSQLSFLGGGEPYSESPVASLSHFDRPARVSTRDFAAAQYSGQGHRPNFPSARLDATIPPAANVPLNPDQHPAASTPALQPQGNAVFGPHSRSNEGMYGDFSLASPPMNLFDDVGSSWRTPQAEVHLQGVSTSWDLSVHGNPGSYLPEQLPRNEASARLPLGTEPPFQAVAVEMTQDNFDEVLDLSGLSDDEEMMMDVEPSGRSSHPSSTSLQLQQESQAAPQMQTFTPAPLPLMSNPPQTSPWNPWSTCSHGHPTCAWQSYCPFECTPQYN